MLPELEQVFPGSNHVCLLNLDTADDKVIWEYAKKHDFAIVTLDSDFHELATLYGAPPKIVWLKIGNQSRRHVVSKLLQYQRQILMLEGDAETTVIEIY
jgi:predicted nuclease of predicted toxin-antitoxin system